MQNLAVELNKEIRQRIPFGNMEVQRAVDGTKSIKFERLLYIAKLYSLKLAIKKPDDDKWYFFGERSHEFVKQLSFMFLEKYDEETEALERRTVALGMKPKFFSHCTVRRVSPDVKDIEIIADHLGCQFKFVERDYEDMERDLIR